MRGDILVTKKSRVPYNPSEDVSSLEDYMRFRVDNQINWYDKKSATQKKWFYRFRLTTLVASISIPFTAGLVTYSHCFLTLTSLLGLISAISEGVASFTKVHDKWIQYRSIVEGLKHEKYMFQMRSGVYDDPVTNIDKMFVSRIETLVSSETINWANMNSSQREDKK